MLGVIPAAGIGKRLRPHTLNKPKALLPVAGKPILGHIVDDLQAAGVDRFVIVVGYQQESVRDWFARERSGLSVVFVEQAERLGLGHAIWTAREAVGDKSFFCILGDTILKADYQQLLATESSVIGVREVDDPRRFGVVEMAGERVARFVEKPDQPRSNLAIVGAYLFRDSPALWQALTRIVEQDIRTKGEYQLTDALQIMIENGGHFRTAAVSDWYDCGKAETWLQTNRVLLDRTDSGPAMPGVQPPCAVASDVKLLQAEVGPHVSIGPGTVLENCVVSDCVIGSRSHLRDCHLRGSLVGDSCQVFGVRGQVNLGDYCELHGRRD